jgi:hypothetical protein
VSLFINDPTPVSGPPSGGCCGDDCPCRRDPFASAPLDPGSTLSAEAIVADFPTLETS